MTHHQEWSTQSTTEKQDEVSSQLVSVIDGEGKALNKHDKKSVMKCTLHTYKSWNQQLHWIKKCTIEVHEKVLINALVLVFLDLSVYISFWKF